MSVRGGVLRGARIANSKTNGFAPNSKKRNGFAPNSKKRNGFAPNSKKRNGFAPNAKPNSFAPKFKASMLGIVVVETMERLA